MAMDKRQENLLATLGIEEPNVMLTKYELIASQFVDISFLKEQGEFEDIIGQEEKTVVELLQTLIIPIQRKANFAGSDLSAPPKGVLLHGPIGCAKTVVAKATAREARARMICLNISSLTNESAGENKKLLGAVFSLARKIQPCFIYIEEINNLISLKSRKDPDIMLLANQFMHLLDSLTKESKTAVVVIGGTDNIRDLDDAIMKRMPVSIGLGLLDQSRVQPKPREQWGGLTQVNSMGRTPCMCSDHSVGDMVVCLSKSCKEKNPFIIVTELGDMVIAFASKEEPTLFVTERGDLIITTPDDDDPEFAASLCSHCNYGVHLYANINSEESLPNLR